MSEHQIVHMVGGGELNNSQTCCGEIASEKRCAQGYATTRFFAASEQGHGFSTSMYSSQEMRDLC